MYGGIRKYCRWLLPGIFLVIFGITPIYSQLTRPGKPLSLVYKDSPPIDTFNIEISPFQKAFSVKEDGSLLKPASSGSLAKVSVSPLFQGTWDTIPDGTKIWRYAFHIKDASVMSLVFSPFTLGEGVRVYIYDRSQQHIAGAFSDLNNKAIDLLATSEIPGNMLIVEMQVPAFIASYGSFGIAGVGWDFQSDNEINKMKDGWFGKSGSCNVDIRCSDDTLIQKVKNSVVRIVFRGHERCTGTLVNTARNLRSNYVLTAGHCFTGDSAEFSANTAVFYFNYESPECNGRDGDSEKSLSGATIRASNSDIDFALLELLEPVPFYYHPYYAGWDYSGSQPQSGTVIHHPQGDVKKISTENHPLTITSFERYYNDKTHWLVPHWESGTTEPGSSGAPFLDTHGRIVGTLTGGHANCDKSILDYFQMFSHSWDDYAAPEKQLACWLDPFKNTLGYQEGKDPYSDLWATGDTLTNIMPGEPLTAEKGNLTWGSYSGHNSTFAKEFAERFQISTGKKISGLLLNVQNNFVDRALRFLRIKVWDGGEIPGKVLYEKSILLSDLTEGSVNFIEFDSVVHVDPVFFTGYELQYYSTQDTFATFMAGDRGSENLNTAYINDGDQWKSLTDFTGGLLNSSFGIYPLVYDSIPDEQNQNNTSEYVTAWPNPASSILQVMFHEVISLPATITIVNMQGQTVFKNRYAYPHIIPLDISGIAGGLYLIRVNQGNRVNNIKVVIVK